MAENLSLYTADQAISAFLALEEMKFALQYSYKLNLYNAAHTKYLKALYIKNTSNKNLEQYWTWNWEVSLKIKLKSSFFFSPKSCADFTVLMSDGSESHNQGV